MVTWEFKIVDLPVEAGMIGLIEALNADGEEGWETYQVDRAKKRVSDTEDVMMFVIFQKRQRMRVLLADGSQVPLGVQRRGQS